MSERVRTAGVVDLLSLVEGHAKDAGLSMGGLFTAAGLGGEGWKTWRDQGLIPDLETVKKLLAVPTTTGTPARSAQ